MLFRLVIIRISVIQLVSLLDQKPTHLYSKTCREEASALYLVVFLNHLVYQKDQLEAAKILFLQIFLLSAYCFSL